MAKLSYKSRLGVRATGLQKVWFCAHPDDYAEFLEKTANEILSLVNCAVWYDEEPEKEYDLNTLEEDLSLTQLFVIPVTEKFLTESNRAIDTELGIATANRIPVLPILEDESLANLFNEKCGNLQYLCPTQNDGTTASFREKLADFLSTVLVGDDLIQKAKDAFDAYIFLSYRKKDRAFAQELMRIIHKNDFCRDIAIWYDEFLIPGENFDEAISKAMHKSCLFAMVVTPNLLEENNYVSKIEYPAAKESGIRILPAEMQETDSDELKKKYPDIPSVTNAYDSKGLKNALMDSLSDIAKSERNSSPTHKFFIGLAYLGGIDVEIDKERAIRLITEASDDGMTEATEKLVSLYRYGEAVSYNKESMCFFQSRLIEQTQKLYEESPTEDALNKYINAIYSSATSYLEEYQTDKAIELYQSALELCKKMPSEQKNAEKATIARILNKIASCYKMMGLYREAIINCQDSLRTLHELDKVSSSFSLKMQIANTLVDLADIRNEAGEYRLASDNIHEAEEILLDLENEFSKDECIPEDLSHCYYLIAKFLYEKYRHQEALFFAEKCLQIDAQNAKFQHIAKALKNELTINSLLCSILVGLRENEKADKHLERFYMLAKDYSEKKQSIDAKEIYATAVAKMGQAYMRKQNYDKALGLYTEAIDIFSSIAERINSEYSLSWLGTVLGYCTYLFEKQGKISEAEDLYKRCIFHYEKSIKRLDTLRLKNNLAYRYSSYANFLSKSGKNEDAISFYEKSAKTFLSAYKINHDHRNLRFTAQCYIHIAKAASVLRNDALAVEAYTKAIEYYRDIISKIKWDINYVIEAALNLVGKVSESADVKYYLLISCYTTELLLSDPENESLIRKKERAEQKLREFALRYGNSDYALNAYDDAVDYFLDKNEATAKRFAAILLIFVADRRNDEERKNRYIAAGRQYELLLRDHPDDEYRHYYLTQRENLLKKINDPEEQEEDDDNSDSFDELDLEALIDEIFSEDDNQN